MAIKDNETWKVLILCSITIFGCQAKQASVEKKSTDAGKVKHAETKLAEWYGVYASVEEESGGEGRILVLYEGALREDGGGAFRMKAWIDFGVSIGDEAGIKLDEVSGEFLVSGKQVYIPVPKGRGVNGKLTKLSAGLSRYTRATVNQEVVLVPDHALGLLEKNELHKAAGVLIKLHLAEEDYRDFDIAGLESLPSLKLITN